MATYHGLVELSCIVCKWETKEDNTMEVINDMDGTCPKCENQFFRWVNEDGSIVVSLIKDDNYDNLVMNEEDKK